MLSWQIKKNKSWMERQRDARNEQADNQRKVTPKGLETADERRR